MKLKSSNFCSNLENASVSTANLKLVSSFHLYSKDSKWPSRFTLLTGKHQFIENRRLEACESKVDIFSLSGAWGYGGKYRQLNAKLLAKIKDLEMVSLIESFIDWSQRGQSFNRLIFQTFQDWWSDSCGDRKVWGPSGRRSTCLVKDQDRQVPDLRRRYRRHRQANQRVCCEKRLDRDVCRI